MKSHSNSLNEKHIHAKTTFSMQHIDTAQTNLCPHSYEESCSTAHSMLFFPAEISRVDSSLGFFNHAHLHGHRCARAAQSRREAGPSSKEGNGLFPSAAMHVLNYFKYEHKDFKYPISIQIFKTFVSSLKDHFQLAIQILHSTVLRELVYAGFFLQLHAR